MNILAAGIVSVGLLAAVAGMFAGVVLVAGGAYLAGAAVCRG